MEAWVDISGFEDIYQVSNFGRVRSLDRLVQDKDLRKSRMLKGRVLKGKVTKPGYVEVGLRDLNKKVHFLLIHRIVAKAFIPNPEGKPQVNHLNGIKNDNRSSNLEWSTHKENVQHALLNGLTKVGEDSTSSKLTNEEVLEIRSLFRTKKYTFSELGRMFNVDSAGIGRIVKGLTWKHLPVIQYDFDIDALERKRKTYKKKLSEEQINEAAQMLASGVSKRKIAVHFGVTHTTINRFLKEKAL